MATVSSSSWSDAERWISYTLVPHLHQNPLLRLAGRPRLQYTPTFGPEEGGILGNSSAMSRQRLADLHMSSWSSKL